jgi:opacity protein-like surface antigen
VTTDHKLSWFGTSRTRLGVLWTPNVLLYGTAGVAYGQVKDTATVNAVGVGSATSTSLRPRPGARIRVGCGTLKERRIPTGACIEWSPASA